MRILRSRRDRSALSVMFILLPGLVLACSGEGSPTHTPKADLLPACDVTSFRPDVLPGEETEVMVPTRDCVELSTDVYLPDSAGPYPAVLLRLPYDKERGMLDLPLTKLVALIFRSQGYAVVIQDTRGRFDSEGEWNPMVHEQRDGLDTVRWIEAQTWFDGNLGLFGASYFGFTEYAVAHQGPASLRAAAPLITTGDIYAWFFHNGLPRPDIIVKWALGMHEKDEFDAFPEEAFLRAALHWPLLQGDDVTVGDTSWYNEWLEHPFDDGWYDRYLPGDFMQNVDTPLLMLTGWFDIFLPDQLAEFEDARSRAKDPRDVRIILGPWTHSMGFMEDHDFPFRDPKFVLSFVEIFTQWYDHYLRGAPLTTAWGPVRIYDPGLGTWIDRDTLWAKDREPFTLYLHGDQGAGRCEPMGGIEATPPAVDSQISYTYDPLDPVVNYGGPLLNMRSGCTLEEAHCSRPDVLTFVSAPFPADVPLDGEMHLDLTVSSTAPDTAFVGRLSLIRADGKAYYFRQGAMTLSHRDGNTRPAHYTPGDVVEIRIDLPPVLWTLRAGERLRLEVSSSSFPSVAQHPNVADNPWGEPQPVSALQTLHLGPGRTARLVFQADRNQASPR
jgi:uncharacterized protein